MIHVENTRFLNIFFLRYILISIPNFIGKSSLMVDKGKHISCVIRTMFDYLVNRNSKCIKSHGIDLTLISEILFWMLVWPRNDKPNNNPVNQQQSQGPILETVFMLITEIMVCLINNDLSRSKFHTHAYTRFIMTSLKFWYSRIFRIKSTTKYVTSLGLWTHKLWGLTQICSSRLREKS